MQEIKLMTYNIHYGIGRDKQYRLDRIIKVIQQQDPDIIALQEVDNAVSRSDFDDQSRLIAESLDMHYFHCVNRPMESGEFGITTLSRFPISHNQRFELTYQDRLEPRGALRSDIGLPQDQVLHVFNIHLGLRPWERIYQRNRLLSNQVFWHDSVQGPLVALGDFNDHVASVVHEKFRTYFTDSRDVAGMGLQPTFHYGRLRLRLDYIYTDRCIQPLETYVVKDDLAYIASDHLPLVTRIALQP